MTANSAPIDTPFHINFVHQKKRAKELRRDIQRKDTDAVKRFKCHHPQSASLSAEDIKTNFGRLSDAQLVIAREFGLASWAKLKVHTSAMAAAGLAIEHKQTPPDGAVKTLHIRCGTDIEETLKAAGFSGDFLEYSNPFCQGRVSDGPDMLAIRAEFLSTSYTQSSYADTLSHLQSEESGLANAARHYERVVLWFEHDSFDQLILIRILAFFADNKMPKSLEIIELENFPGSIRFIGLGQLPPEALRLLWRQRTSISSQQLNLGWQAWQALVSSDPTSLAEMSQSTTSILPNLARALNRHLQELPSTFNGLSLTQQFIIEILNTGSRTAGMIFRDLMVEKEPLPWLGDLMFWNILKSMGQTSQPVYKISSASANLEWPKQHLTLTNAGGEILAGERTWFSLNPPVRWLGGVEIAPHKPCWHWNNDSQIAEFFVQE